MSKTLWNTEGLSPMALGRLNKALDKLYRFPDGVRSLRAQIESFPAIEKRESDGMIDFSRAKFNRLDDAEQAAYTAKLKARRYFWINDLQVPKIVYDACQPA